MTGGRPAHATSNDGRRFDFMTVLLKFRALDRRYALARLPADSPDPAWVAGRFTAVIRSPLGVTVVCEVDALPDGLTERSNFRCIEVIGAFALESIGVVAAAVGPLAAAGISVFAYSTWETDYILVQEGELDRAINALKAAGHTFPSA
jgi:hypothetical protein